MSLKVDKNQSKDKEKVAVSKRKEPKELDIGTRILWHLNKKEYKKVNNDKPFAKWESLNGGVLFIDDVRVRRKDTFTIIEDTI